MYLLTKLFKILLRILIAFLVLSIASVFLFKWVAVPITPLMLIRCAEQKSEGKDMVLKDDWVS